MDYSESADDSDGSGEGGDPAESSQTEEKPAEENQPSDPIGNLEDLGF